MPARRYYIPMHHETDLEWLRAECANAESFEELAAVAVAEMEKFEDAEIVCGPLTTGGLGSMEKNMAAFLAVIDMLKKEGRPIYSQGPYEERIAYLRDRWREHHPSRAQLYCTPILEVLYARIFDAGRIRRAWFIPGWESSLGATWEHDRLKGAGVEIEYLTPERIQSLL
ncbi:MAG: hypothetical protein JWL87_428 [Candidatus Adlerbacteria bacterium]|nr:hypothetical protein [Candidatus Adlerbacteria bacterium]